MAMNFMNFLTMLFTLVCLAILAALVAILAIVIGSLIIDGIFEFFKKHRNKEEEK